MYVCVCMYHGLYSFLRSFVGNGKFDELDYIVVYEDVWFKTFLGVTLPKENLRYEEIQSLEIASLSALCPI